jgi:hypothetical protein
MLIVVAGIHKRQDQGGIFLVGLRGLSKENLILLLGLDECLLEEIGVWMCC